MGLASVALAMAIGGILNARRVAETMSRKITRMNPGQGFTANLVTAFLMTSASRLGLPVSTTHVSVGSLFGIGVVNRTAGAKTVLAILVAWATTLPTGAVLAAATYYLLGPRDPRAAPAQPGSRSSTPILMSGRSGIAISIATTQSVNSSRSRKTVHGIQASLPLPWFQTEMTVRPPSE